MHEALLQALRDQRPTLLVRWGSLLRAQPSPNALGNPDVLVLLMDWTLEEWESILRRPHARRRRSPGVGAAASESEYCPCGQNPLLGYFRSAETALDEPLHPRRSVLSLAILSTTRATRSAQDAPRRPSKIDASPLRRASRRRAPAPPTKQAESVTPTHPPPPLTRRRHRAVAVRIRSI
jgi:hypothetical protein